jgi:hypothetical protein
LQRVNAKITNAISEKLYLASEFKKRLLNSQVLVASEISVVVSASGRFPQQISGVTVNEARQQAVLRRTATFPIPKVQQQTQDNVSLVP